MSFPFAKKSKYSEFIKKKIFLIEGGKMKLVLLYVIIGVAILIKTLVEIGSIPANNKLASYCTCIIYVVAWPLVIFICVITAVMAVCKKKPIYKVGNAVVIRLDKRRPFSVQGYLYTVAKVKNIFGIFVYYDLEASDSSGNLITQKNVPEKAIMKWSDFHKKSNL